MNILFIGCVESSYALLKELFKMDVNVVGVITKQSSRFNADFVDLSELCITQKIPYIYVDNVNDFESEVFIDKVCADWVFCFGWSQLIGEKILARFSGRIVGFHPAKLPYNRGRHPIIWAIVLGLKETASTFFLLDKNPDAGAIISQELIPIDYSDDAKSLYAKVIDVAIKQELKIICDFKNNTVNYVEQAKGTGNSWRKRRFADGVIDFRMSSYAIYNLVRGLTHPYIGASLIYNDKEYKVWKVEEVFSYTVVENIEPGKVLKVHENGWIDVKAYDNVVRLVDFEYIEVNEGEYI